MTATTDPHLDPELAPLLETFPDLPVNEQTLPGFRAAMKEMAVLPDPASHPAVTIEEVSVPRSDGATVRCLHLTPSKGDPVGALLQVHGGGFVMGSPEMDAPRNAALVEALGCAILSVDYRLAPEHPHPAGLEDCYSALQWLLSGTQESGIPVGLIGDSAGGGLAASLALLARDRGDRKLACQALIYPMIALPGSESEVSTADPRIGRYICRRGRARSLRARQPGLRFTADGGGEPGGDALLPRILPWLRPDGRGRGVAQIHARPGRLSEASPFKVAPLGSGWR